MGGEREREVDELVRSSALHAFWIWGASCWKKLLSAQMQATSVVSQLVEVTAASAGWSLVEMV